MEYIVDGKKMTEEEMRELQQNGNIRLKKLSEDKYKTLKKLEG